MTRATLAPVSCPSCGAGLAVLGGGRVVMQICGFCGTALDAVENYAALRKFANMTRPGTPFSIGMTGRLIGQDWTVIGILASAEYAGGRAWTWIDHLLYSVTHGYLWLTLENGHLILTRRYRGSVSPGWISVDQVEAAETPPMAQAAGETFKYYETSTSRITFAEGEFTWRVAIGAETTAVTLMSDSAMISYAVSGTEREVERSVYLPQAETFAAFKTTPTTPYRTHPLQPFVAGPQSGFLMRLGAASAAVCGVLTLVFAGMSGSTILPLTEIPRSSLPQEVTLPVDRNGLAVITLNADVRNAWAFLDVTLTDPEGLPVFATGREVGYYSGYDDGAWTEGSTSTRIRFRPDQTGDYSLELDVPEAGTDEINDTLQMTQLTVSATNGGASPLWTLIAAIGFLGLAAYHLARPFLHNRARWHGTDWTED